MLTKSEKAIMSVIYDKCGNDGSCLISVNEISVSLHRRGISDKKIKSTLKSLELDGYYDLIVCDKGGEEYYCINFQAKGYSYKRESEQFKRAVLSKIIFAVVTALITFFVTRLLFMIF